MKASDFYAVIFDHEVFCVGCLPDGVSVDDEEVQPLFPGDEWDYYPSCCECGEGHDYTTLTI